MPPRRIPRREMMSRAAHASLGLAIASFSRPLAAASQKRWFKIGACDWSLGKGDPSCFEVAKQSGLDGVQVNMGGASNDMQLRRPEIQKAYLDAAKAQGLEVASLALGELNSVPLASEPRAAIWLLDSIEVARALKVQVILMAFFGKGEV